ncbi:hypothetical protein EMCRGX_G033722 [Ephydatia muelleri]
MGCLYFWTERLLRGLTLGFNDYLLLRLVLVDCRSSLAIKLQVIQKLMWFTYVTNAARNYGYKCFFVWRLLVHLFLSGGLTAVLSVSLLASKRLSLLV